MSEGIVIGELLIQVALIIISAKLFGHVFSLIKQPKVLGELVAGVILGPSLLNVLHLHNPVILFLAELGVIALLFEVGLESNLSEMLKSGVSSLLVAIIGVIAPVLLALPYLIGVEAMDLNLAIFVGATLTATSVGLTMRVLGELNKISSIEGKVILGAAVIDDVIGLIILSVLNDMASTGTVNFGNMLFITGLSIAFLAVTVLVGRSLEGPIISIVKKLKVDRTYIVSSFAFVLIMSFLANLIGLATIVGAFAAGLLLEKEEHLKKIAGKTNVLTDLFAPVFFVVAGAGVDLHAFTLELLPFIVILTIIAVLGKIVAGLGAFREKASKLAIGVGMIPRGEVGLIFASVGLTAGLISGGIYSALVLVIMITTFITPPILKALLDKKN